MTISAKLVEAYRYLESHAHTQRAIITIVDELDSIEKLGQLRSEAEKALADRRAELADFGREEREHIERERNAAAILRKEASDVLAKARTEASAIKAKANEAADKLDEKARKERDAENEKAAAEVARKRQELEVITDEFAGLAKRREELAAEVADLEARVQKAKDFIKSFATG